MSNIFCLWSGGLDSTFLIAKLLDEGHNVTCGYINLTNNEHMIKREEIARNKIKEYFYVRYPQNFKYIGNICNITLNKFNPEIRIIQPYVWLFSYLSLPNKIDTVAIGYIMNDDAISFLDDIRNIFKAYTMLNDQKIDLSFPIIKFKKSEIWHSSLMIDIRKDVSWCEDESNDNCGKCDSCKRMLEIVPTLFGNDSVSYIIEPERQYAFDF